MVKVRYHRENRYIMSLQSQILSKYYQRHDNSIRFTNGLSLNQLARSMWDDVGYPCIDVSTLSRVINGLDSLNKDQVLTIARVLDFPIIDLISLLHSVEEKNIIDFNFPQNKHEIIEFLQGEMAQLPKLRQTGNLKTARMWIDNALNILRSKKTLLESTNTGAFFKTTSDIEATLLIHQARNFAENAQYGMGSNLLNPYVHSLQQAQLVKSDSTRALSFITGDACYVDKQFKITAEKFSQAAQQNNDLYLHLEALRGAILAYAYLNQRKQFDKHVSEALHFIETNQVPTNYLLSVFEGIGRGFAFFKEFEAFRYLEMADQACNELIQQGQNMIFPKIQIVRSYSMALQKLKMSDQGIINQGKTTAHLARTFGYTRHSLQIENLLQVLT